MKLLVTGGSGMVGSELRKILPTACYPSSRELDLMDQTKTREYLFDYKFDYVIHLAAHVGSLHDNIENSISYFENNIIMNTLITKYSFESGVKNFLGVLSTCIYPDNISVYPIMENQLHDGKPHQSLMSYAYSKRSHAVQIDQYKTSKGVNYNFLIPSNLYGIVNKKYENRSHFLNDLVFKIIEAKSSNKDFIKLFGDGTPLRQFMYSQDFARIIEFYVKNNLNISMNVAPDENLSIDEMARMAISLCENKNLNIEYDSSKPNGQFRKDVSNKIFRRYYPDFEFTPLAKGIEKLLEYYSR
jgi:GDP-L-fucose synthase